MTSLTLTILRRFQAVQTVQFARKPRVLQLSKMHQYCSSLVYKHVVDQCQSETTLQCTNSSSEFKAPQPSKSDHNLISGKSLKPNTWQYNLVELIEGTQGLTCKVKAEIKRFVTDFLEKRASPKKLETGTPYTRSGPNKKRARPITPVITKGISLKKPKLDTTPCGKSSIEKINSHQSSYTPTTESKKRNQDHDENTHYKKRLFKRFQATSSFEEITGPLIQTQSKPNLTEGPKDTNAHNNAQTLHRTTVSCDEDTGPLIQTRSKPNVSVAESPTDENTHNDERLLKRITTTAFGNVTVPLIQTQKKPDVIDSPKDENAHHNERELKIIVTSPTDYIIPTAIETSIQSCLNDSPDAADDDDDELDNEVATILANGVPPSVCGYRQMPPTVGGYRPIPEYNALRLIQDRELKGLEFLGQHGAYHQCGPTLRFTREHSKNAIKIPDSRPYLYRNKEFDELENVGSIQTENRSSFWTMPSN